MKTHRNRLVLLAALLGIAAITVFACYPGMSAGFYFDDAPNLLAVSTYQRNVVWGDPVSFHRDVAQKSPEKFRQQYTLGTEPGMRGMFDEARIALARALRIRPDGSRAHNQLGNVYLMTHQPRQAERY
ncbi:MAG TPA: tetratricopeptide repeat protein [Woeseiaceae bacterium]|nr:tetratricopeptide repeat protein [Woeseiaceae bacterium]